MQRLSDYLKQTYGEKVYKLSLSSGCTCPTRDGTLGYGGCTFCSERGSGDFAAAHADIDSQIEEAKAWIRNKTDAEKYIAYFQAFTNTYGNTERLARLYTDTVRRDDIAVLSLATRPDCLSDDTMVMLKELNAVKPVWVELGLQTVRDDIAELLHRGYPLSVFGDAYRRLKEAGLTVIVHVIFGLPGETKADMLHTVSYLAGLRPELDGIKIQMLHIIRGTVLGDQYAVRPFPLLSMEEYTDLVCEALTILPEKTVVHRMTGDAPGRLLMAPEWTRNKKKVLNTINRKLAETGKTAADADGCRHYPDHSSAVHGSSADGR